MNKQLAKLKKQYDILSIKITKDALVINDNV